MEVEHSIEEKSDFNLIGLCINPCKCPSRLGLVDNFGHTSSTISNDQRKKEYKFDTRGLSSLSPNSIKALFDVAAEHHTGKHPWYFHKQLFMPLIVEMQLRNSEVDDSTTKWLSILLRDALMHDDQESAEKIIVAGANVNWLAPFPLNPEIIRQPVFFFAKTMALLQLCVEYKGRRNAADLEFTDDNQATILHKIAADTSMPEETAKKFIVYCIDHGAPINARNNCDETAKDIAKDIAGTLKRYGVVDILLQHEATQHQEEAVNSHEKEQTPVSQASTQNNTQAWLSWLTGGTL